jgi:hypothetical protein
VSYGKTDRWSAPCLLGFDRARCGSSPSGIAATPWYHQSGQPALNSRRDRRRSFHKSGFIRHAPSSVTTKATSTSKATAMITRFKSSIQRAKRPRFSGAHSQAVRPTFGQRVPAPWILLSTLSAGRRDCQQRVWADWKQTQRTARTVFPCE